MTQEIVAADVVLGPVETVADSPAEAAAEEESGASGFGVSFVGLVDTSDLTIEPLIEEPVASGGDSSLWVDGDERCEDDEDCEDGDEP